MGLSVYLVDKYGDEKYSRGVTHNLSGMANAVSEDFYKALWHPEEIGAKYAKDIINILTTNIKELSNNQEKYKKYNAPNGWGDIYGLLSFTEEYLEACIKYSDCEIKTWV